ncbi:MAG: hypothetical protein ABI999_12710 [Acidobacteriota bacterium]
MTSSGSPASGNFDFEFALFDQATGGTQLGATLSRNIVPVLAGNFAVNLDFGNQYPGAGRFLEIRVRQTGGGALTSLTPRQAISSSPYSVKSLNADSATNASQLGGTVASQFVQTGDPRLADQRAPAPGSTNYIQNGTGGQTASFNINGTGAANAFNATTDFRIGGNRILGNTGTSNLFAGAGAGFANSTGNQNAFFGSGAGQANNAGSANAFFGSNAGAANTTANFNAFFGGNAGSANTTGANNAFFGGVSGIANTTGFNNAFFGSGSGQTNLGGAANAFFGESAGNANNSGSGNAFFGEGSGKFNTTGGSNAFFGLSSGSTNTTGSNNSLFGTGSNVSSANLSFATAIGAGATVSASNTVVVGRATDAVQVPGSLSVSGTIAGTVSTATNALNLGGVAANQYLTATSGSASFIQNSTVFQPASNFNISGSGTAGNTLSANFVNAADSYFANGQRVLRTDVIGRGDTMVGLNAGSLNEQNGNGANSFFGFNSGRDVIAANNNSYFGYDSGASSSVGSNNAFFGFSSGKLNGWGNFNAFFGSNAGSNNAGNSGGAVGNNNSFIGSNSGITNTVGNNNTLVGASSNVSVNNLSNSTAVGANAQVSQSNSLVLGAINGVNGALVDTSVGIGTTAPAFRFHLVDTQNTGMRVQTNTAGGTVASFGGLGSFQIDAPGSAGGRVTVKENGNTGIGTNNPNTKLQVNGSVYIQNPNSLIITSPNGLCWFITVNNAGALSTISVTCP